MLGWNAVEDIDVSKLNRSLITKLEGISGLVETIDDWVLTPDKELLTPLITYAKLLKPFNDIPKGSRLFRGFDPKSDYQDTLGLSYKGFFVNKVRNYSVGYEFSYVTENPISFTTSERIAGEFGSTIVELKELPNDYIWLSDELSYLISKRRKIKPETQKELIVLPTAVLKLKVIKK